MSQPGPSSRETGRKMATFIGTLLRTGVILAATVVLAGAVVYLARHGMDAPQYHAFRGEPSDLCSVTGIVADAVALSGRGIIQLGLLLLIATPVMRVAVSLAAFLLERDWTYVVATLIVLSLLIYSLLGGSL
jgi:uncharacterized membrane protein